MEFREEHALQGRVTFFLDNCIPPRIGLGLRGFGADIRILREEFAKPSVLDVEWMPIVAVNGWILVTDDNRIRRNRAERVLLENLKLSGVFLPGSLASLGLWEQAAKVAND